MCAGVARGSRQMRFFVGVLPGHDAPRLAQALQTYQDSIPPFLWPVLVFPIGLAFLVVGLLVWGVLLAIVPPRWR